MGSCLLIYQFAQCLSQYGIAAESENDFFDDAIQCGSAHRVMGVACPLVCWDPVAASVLDKISASDGVSPGCWVDLRSRKSRSRPGPGRLC